MKMNYPQKSRREGAKNFTPFLVIAIIVGAVFLVQTVSPRLLPSIANTVAVPIWKAQVAFSGGWGVFLDFFKSKESLHNENEALKEKITSDETALLDRDMLIRENDALRQLLGRVGNLQSDILAEVLVKPPQSAYDTLIIDIGTDKKINIGDRVFFSSEVLLGEVIEVNSHTSKVKLYSTAGNITEATLEKEKISVSLTGLGGGTFETQLPREVVVQKGDLLIIPGIPNFILGTVMDIELGAADSLQKILVKSPVNISELRWVGVLTTRK